MRKRWIFTALLAALLVVWFVLRGGSDEPVTDPVVVFTQVPAGHNNLPSVSGPEVPDYQQARIVSLNLDYPRETPSVLTSDLYSASSPSLSFDNKRIVFSAKPSENDPWQIWTMELDGSGQEMLFKGDQNCYTPSFLPTGEIVFSCDIEDPAAGTITPLFKIQTDGSDPERITFHPHQDLYTSMLHDGRIAMISRQLFPEEEDPVFMVLRPDGTKAQAFYHKRTESRIKSTVRESLGESLIFIQTDRNRDELVALSYANPLLPSESILSGNAGTLHSADLLDSTRVVISAKGELSGLFGLRIAEPDGSNEILFEEEGYHSVEPVSVRNKRVPKKLPSSISDEPGSGILISQDVNHSQIDLEGDPQARFIRIEGIGKTLDEIDVAEDGSFYLRVQSDMPVRFVSLDENRRVLRGPSAWVWMRTNERRACVGCHAKKEIAPRNIVPQAIRQEPVMITDSARTIGDAEVQAIREMVNQK
jgi:hypothetical protein